MTAIHANWREFNFGTPPLERHTKEECEAYFKEWLDTIHQEEAKVEKQKREYAICYQQFRNQK